MTIWPLQAWQIPQMAQIERLCFSDPWSQKALEEELENPLALYFVACEGADQMGQADVSLDIRCIFRYFFSQQLYRQLASQLLSNLERS